MRKVCTVGLSILIALMLPLSIGCGIGPASDADRNTPASGATGENSKEPFAKYENIVTLTAGIPVNPHAAKLPEGDTAEDNGYTRHFFDLSNIKIEGAFEADRASGAYEQKVKLAIARNDLPDFLVVHDFNLFRQMVAADQLCDMTAYYQDYASPLVKMLYESGNNLSLQMATFDGKLMALPDISMECNSEYALWLRQDWLNKLELQAPNTVDEIMEVAAAFASKDPDCNGQADTIGLTGFNIIFNMMNGFDSIFEAFESYPRQWLKDSSGSVIYGAVAPETKQALAKLAEMYAEDAIDPDFAIRNDPNEKIIAGKAGMFFGPFWSPMAISDILANDPAAEWRAYGAPLDASGRLNAAMAAPASVFLVVRKDCADPDAVVRYFNWNIRYGRFEDPMVDKIYDSSQTDLSNNLNFTPIDFVLDYADALDRKFSAYTDVMKGKTTKDALDNEGQMNIDWFNKERDNPKQDPLAWGQYHAYMTGGAVFFNNLNLNKHYSLYYGQTPSMAAKWASLQKLENEAMLKIILGQEKPDYFDTFVTEWLQLGGSQITEEVAKAIK